ncbi:MAG TPA: hypothetical protein VFU74_21645 [Actinocrinis sp.]|nr:hypothetical protein [Actinocrinis sp.]
MPAPRRTADGIGREQRFTGETLRTGGNTREQQLRAVTAVLRAVPGRQAQREVLDALFATGRRTLPPHGMSPSREYKEARKAWLARCRAWVIAQGRHPRSAQISTDDQRDYADATGDRWVPPRGEPER